MPHSYRCYILSEVADFSQTFLNQSTWSCSLSLLVIFILVNMNLYCHVGVKDIFFMNFNCYHRQSTIWAQIHDHSTGLFLLRTIIYAYCRLWHICNNLLKPMLSLCACKQSKCLLAISHSIHLASTHSFTSTSAKFWAFVRWCLPPQ